jgi:hypothetical protein
MVLSPPDRFLGAADAVLAASEEVGSMVSVT